MHRVNKPDTRLYLIKSPYRQKTLATQEPSTQDINFISQHKAAIAVIERVHPIRVLALEITEFNVIKNITTERKLKTNSAKWRK
jgi:hypothetical protein